MSLPKYNELYIPLLTAIYDGKVYTMKEIADCLPKRTPVPYSADSVCLIIRTDTNDYSTVFLT